MIEMQDVTKKYPNGIMAANGLNILINQGEFVFVVGPSGAGKTTFIKMIYREEKPTTGKIIVNGFNLSSLKIEKFRICGGMLGSFSKTLNFCLH